VYSAPGWLSWAGLVVAEKPIIIPPPQLIESIISEKLKSPII